ncbi:hypothetical protein AWENTII_012699 [Aspergillus wentii]
MDEPPPKRRRSSNARIRVTRACDVCKRKKLRCSGTIPCAPCLRSHDCCQYNAGYTRGKLPAIPPLNPSQPLPLQSPPNTDVEAESSIVNIDTARSDCISEHPDPETEIQNEEEPRQFSSSHSPEPAQTDQEGHYVGPASGASFLIRVQKRLHENVTFSEDTPIFNFGDAPLSEYGDASMLVLPPKDEADALVDRYFDFAFPTHRFLHQPTVKAWLDGMYASVYRRGAGSLERGARETRALLLMVMAQAKQYLLDNDAIGGCVDSTIYFGASESHLAAETGPVRLTSIQARLMQCFYLLSESRINHCWSLFGTTARLALAIGLHRRRRRERGVDYIEQECRKRVFWCAYSLDNYLSAALGRPKIFHDEDIDQELPVCANDSQIMQSRILPRTSKGQSIMLAPVYHAKLSKIISGILKDLYGIRVGSLESQVQATERHESELEEWRKGIASFLDVANTDVLMVVYQRQHTVLSLAFAHAKILLHRPFLFRILASLSSGRSADIQTAVRTGVERCLEAASRVVAIFRELCANKRMYPSFWFTHYYVFSAIVVLYVHVICSQSDSSDNWHHYLESGEQAQQELSTCGTNSSFAHRYVVVLEELRREALKAVRQKSGAALPKESPLPTQDSPCHCREDRAIDQGNMRLDQLFGIENVGSLQEWMDGLMDGSPRELAGWGEFDSLAGLGSSAI